MQSSKESAAVTVTAGEAAALTAGEEVIGVSDVADIEDVSTHDGMESALNDSSTALSGVCIQTDSYCFV